jgi:hypothetical protein
MPGIVSGIAHYLARYEWPCFGQKKAILEEDC